MPKNVHEIRDAIHVFVRLDTHEREVLNSVRSKDSAIFINWR
jgi:hypothetical protein